MVAVPVLDCAVCVLCLRCGRQVLVRFVSPHQRSKRYLKPGCIPGRLALMSEMYGTRVFP